LYILKNFKTKKVICIDIWNKYDDKDKDENLRMFENFKYNLSEFVGRFSFFKNTSDEYFLNNNERFDVIYIDGWHEAPQVYKDLNNSWNRLNNNGLIICDDYFYGDIKLSTNSNLPADAINQFLFEKKNNLEVVCVNNSQIFIKKKLD
jgi:predicted O-methyltransferase YrrM